MKQKYVGVNDFLFPPCLEYEPTDTRDYLEASLKEAQVVEQDTAMKQKQ